MYKWKILEIYATNGIVHAVKYSVEYEGITTEGNWSAKIIDAQIPFENLNENIVINWIKQNSIIDGVNIVEANLEKQAAGLHNKVQMPWRAPTFTPFGE